MAAYHVMTSDLHGHPRVILHIVIPVAETNKVGVSYRELLIALARNTTSMTVGDGPCQITQDEAVLIAAGEVYEQSITYPIESAGGTIQQKKTKLDALATREATATLKRLADEFEYAGYIGA